MITIELTQSTTESRWLSNPTEMGSVMESPSVVTPPAGVACANRLWDWTFCGASSSSTLPLSPSSAEKLWRAMVIKSVQGKYAFVPATSDEFIAQKRREIELER